MEIMAVILALVAAFLRFLPDRREISSTLRLSES